MAHGASLSSWRNRSELGDSYYSKALPSHPSTKTFSTYRLFISMHNLLVQVLASRQLLSYSLCRECLSILTPHLRSCSGSKARLRQRWKVQVHAPAGSEIRTRQTLGRWVSQIPRHLSQQLQLRSLRKPSRLQRCGSLDAARAVGIGRRGAEALVLKSRSSGPGAIGAR
jgi:hypothetical protein